jgi:hypothetical protein
MGRKMKGDRKYTFVPNGVLVRNSAFTLLVLIIMAGARDARAQALNWEGQTGVFVTPLAYTTPTKTNGWGRPVVAYHYLNGGQVLGGFHQVSITEGVLDRIEFGYTRTEEQTASAALSKLWPGGFNTFHGKVNLVREDIGKHNWLPSLSVGFVARQGVRNVTGVLLGKDKSNADLYAVATKTFSQIKLPLVLSAGVKATNASLLGLAGNAPDYKARAFGAVAIAIPGPARSTIMLASELLQQPRSIEGLPGAMVPTTITYAVRIVPSGAFPSAHGWGEEGPKLNIDVGVAQVAGNILPGVNLRARHQFALGVTYAF